MKLNNFVAFENAGNIGVGDIIVVSPIFNSNVSMFLVTGIANEEDNTEYDKYQIVDLNTGKVVYQIDGDCQLFDIWEYFNEIEFSCDYNVLLIENNNIEISFKINDNNKE